MTFAVIQGIADRIIGIVFPLYFTYFLEGNVLKAQPPLYSGSLDAEAWVYTEAPTKVVEFEYNSSGLCTRKKVIAHGQTIATDYIYNGKELVGLTRGEDVLHFFYDVQNKPMKILYNGIAYSYIHNLQGDIVGILDNTNVIVVEYKYDAWGNLLTTSYMDSVLGEENPLRYRGYVYDETIKMYYLQNRYFNAEICRLVNADDVLNVKSPLSLNLYAYCENNPLIYFDPTGKRLESRADLRNMIDAVHNGDQKRVESYMKNSLDQFVKEQLGIPDVHIDFEATPCTKTITRLDQIYAGLMDIFDATLTTGMFHLSNGQGTVYALVQLANNVRSLSLGTHKGARIKMNYAYTTTQNNYVRNPGSSLPVVVPCAVGSTIKMEITMELYYDSNDGALKIENIQYESTASLIL